MSEDHACHQLSGCHVPSASLRGPSFATSWPEFRKGPPFIAMRRIGLYREFPLSIPPWNSAVQEGPTQPRARARRRYVYDTYRPGRGRGLGSENHRGDRSYRGGGSCTTGGDIRTTIASIPSSVLQPREARSHPPLGTHNWLGDSQLCHIPKGKNSHTVRGR